MADGAEAGEARLAAGSRGYAGGRPVLCGAEAQARFLAAVRDGASLKAAAKAGGFALRSFYHARRREPDFAEAWDEAVEDCPSYGTKRHRLRLRGARRALFLEVLEEECNTRAAARAAGVDPATVYRLIRRDPGFARDNEAALARGYGGLEQAALREREARRARTGAATGAIAPTGRPATDFETQMRLLERYRRPARKPGRRRRARTCRPRLTRDELADALILRLNALRGAPLDPAEGGG